jgi:hypothetical protein
VVSSTPRPHFTHGKDPVPNLQGAEWVPGPVWTGGKSRPHRDSIADRPARSQSLYRLSYPAHRTFRVPKIILNMNKQAHSPSGVATRYWLDGPGFESLWSARFSALVQTGPGANPASCTMGTGSFPWVKRPGRDADPLTP